MAKINDNARLIANIIRDKNRLKAQIAGSTDVLQILKHVTDIVKVEVDNVVVSVKDLTGQDCFILDNANFDVLDTNILEVTSSLPSYVESDRRKWRYNTTTLLDTGVMDDNIDTSNGDIRLG